MSHISESEQKRLYHIWVELHGVGKTAEALATARELQNQRRLETQDTPAGPSDYDRELAMMVMVLSKSLAKHSHQGENYDTFLSASTDQLLQPIFPLSHNQSLAAEKGNEWQTVYGADISAQAEIARHMLQLIGLIEVVTHDQKLVVMANALEKILHNPITFGDEETRAGLIDIIEHGEISVAKKALNEFERKFGLGSVYNQGHEANYLRDSLLLRERTSPNIFRWSHIQLLMHHSHFAGRFIGREIAQLANKLRTTLVITKASRNVSFDRAMNTKIAKLTQQKYLGLGNDYVGHLQSGEISQVELTDHS